MKEWLAKIKPPKYLRYLFFIAYSWYRRFSSERSDAHFTAILFLAMLHILAYQIVFFVLNVPPEKSIAILIAIFAGVQFYVWFWYNQKWKSFMEEFNHIKLKQKKRHIIYLLVYAIVCFVIGFFPIIFKMLFGFKIDKLF